MATEQGLSFVVTVDNSNFVRGMQKVQSSVKEASNIWAVPVIDLNAVSGLYPVFDEGAMYYHDAGNDRLHPNDAGHARIARTLIYQLGALPCVF